MKILFLDVDGVLVTTRSHLAFTKNNHMDDFDPVACRLIDRVCFESAARLVLCSTWRDGLNRSDAVELLSSHGISKSHLHEDWSTPTLDGKRYDEIHAWIAHHPGVSHHCVVDDSIDFDGYDELRVVQPDFDDGILTSHFVTMCRHLAVDPAIVFASVGLKL